MRVPLHGIIIADFTATPLARTMMEDPSDPKLEISVAPLLQVVQTLLQPPSRPGSFAVVWSRPESAIQIFRRMLDFEAAEDEDLMEEVAEFARIIAHGARSFRHTFVPTWTLPSHYRGLGGFDAREAGPTRALLLMNLVLTRDLSNVPGVHVLNAQRWFQTVGRPFSPKQWYLGKLPFHPGIFAQAAKDVKAALRADDRPD